MLQADAMVADNGWDSHPKYSGLFRMTYGNAWRKISKGQNDLPIATGGIEWRRLVPIETIMTQHKIPLLEGHSFSRGPANIVISELDLLALKALEQLGGTVGTPADLGEALDSTLDGSRKSLLGGRHLRRLESVGFVKSLETTSGGYEITITGRAAANAD